MDFELKKVVWISPFLPFAKVGHAGGKTHYFYLKKLIESEKFDIRLVSFYKPEELDKFDLSSDIDSALFCLHEKGIKKLSRNLTDLNYLKNPFHKYANFTTKYLQKNILKTLKNYRKEGFCPDIIVLQWTQCVLFVNLIKKIFPNSKIVGIEEDVAFLSFKRKINLAKGKIDKHLKKIRFRNLEKAEITSLKLCDLVILNNEKDFTLLKDYNLKNVHIWSAYYDDYGDVRVRNNSRNVLFYGAMSRPENYLSVEWLLNKVRPLLREENVKFVIVGSKPDKCLEKYVGSDVEITGFVDDVKPYFSDSLCMAAPLVLGAGIKVKILEALSAGLPVLTNDIGIEGIPAESGKDYFHCIQPQEYVEAIKKLINSSELAKNIGINAKEVIYKNFNYKADAVKFIRWLEELVS